MKDEQYFIPNPNEQPLHPIVSEFLQKTKNGFAITPFSCNNCGNYYVIFPGQTDKQPTFCSYCGNQLDKHQDSK